MQALKQLRSRTVVMPTRDIDTDQIIPARFLTTTSKTGLGKHLFHDLRLDSAGRPVEGFPLNAHGAESCQILVAGNNFGCGSSREHAPWALIDFGIRAVISTEIADIFRNNALKNGLLPIVIDAETHAYLLDNPGIEVGIDVAASAIRLPDGRSVGFPIDGFSRYCLLEGIDQLGFLQMKIPEIARFEEGRSWTP
jgi:3-isopropylmalate/(R)-2-methylmalate dehydratase small subunit